MSVYPNTRTREQQEKDKETEKDKKREVSMERSREGTKQKEVPTANHYPKKSNNNKHNILVFCKKLKKVE